MMRTASERMSVDGEYDDAELRVRLLLHDANHVARQRGDECPIVHDDAPLSRAQAAARR